MEGLYGAGMVAFVIQAALLCGLILLVARKEADITWLKLLYLSMAVTCITVGVELAFSRFLFEGTLLLSALLITLLISRMFGIAEWKSAIATALYMLLTFGITLLALHFEGRQDPLMDKFNEQQDSAMEAGLAEVRELMKGLGGPEAAARLDELTAKQEAAKAKAKEESFAVRANWGHSMIRLKDRVVRLVRGAPEPHEPAAEPIPTVPAAVELAANPPEDLPPEPVDLSPSLTEPVATPTPSQTDMRDQRMRELLAYPCISTDPAYENPLIQVTGKGSGANGAFLIVGGRVVRLHDTVRNPAGDTPSAWRLVRIGASEMHWAPVP